jgi:hypothetical protein
MTIELPKISKQELLEAIRAGVSDAMWRMVTNATDAPGADFYDAVKQGIAEGIKSVSSVAYVVPDTGPDAL